MPAFCQRCYDEYVARFNRDHGDDPTFVFHPELAVFRCKTPIFTYSASGRAVVLFYNCENGSTIEMSQEEFVRKRNSEELEI